MRFGFKKIIFTLLTLILLGSGFVGAVQAQVPADSSLGFDLAEQIGSGALGTNSLEETVISVVNIALGFLGLLAVLIIMYGGFVWMTAGGQQDRIDQAKKILRNGVIGLAIILMSWSIAWFVAGIFSRSTGGSLSCTLGETETRGPGGCGFRICGSGSTWTAWDDNACVSIPPASNLTVGVFPNGNNHSPICTIVSAQFNRVIAESTVVGNFNVYRCSDAPASPPTCSTRVGGTVNGVATSLNGSGAETNTVVFSPANDWEANTTYEVEIVSDSFTSTGLASNEATPLYLAGNSLTRFTTGSTGDPNPPVVVPPTTPNNGATDVCRETTLSAHFNEFMNVHTLTGNKVVVNSAGSIPEYRVQAITLTDHHAILARPRSPHDPNQTYGVVIKGGLDGVQDACGNTMGADYGGSGEWEFTTGATLECQPEITNIATVSGGPGYYDNVNGNRVVITGNYFGDNVGGVKFNNNAFTPSNVCLNQNVPYLADALCMLDSSWWSDLQIETYLPAGMSVNIGAQTGPVTLTTTDGLSNTFPSFPVSAPFIRAINSGRVVAGLPAAGNNQFISIWGNNFGNTADRVMLTQASDPANRISADLVCGVGGWTDGQITIAVPDAGLTSGEWLIQVENDDVGVVHRSNIGKFWFDNVTAGPGLCSVNPDSGSVGTPITLSGENFSSLGGSVQVQFGRPGSAITAAGSPSISLAPDTITGAQVPSITPSNDVGIFITNGSVISNSLLFDVLDPTTGPLILNFSPTSGGPGQYVTIIGRRFGNTSGQVLLNNGSDVVNIYNPNSFPDECRNGLWRDDQIIVKLPPYGTPVSYVAGNYTLVVERADGARGTSAGVIPTGTFTANNSAPTPGICAVAPINGVPGEMIDIYGDNYGAVEDEVVFHDSRLAAGIGTWENQSVKEVEIPVGAETGPLVVTVGGVNSNPFNFSVGLCTIDPVAVCGPVGSGFTCCASGAFTGQCRGDVLGISACEPLANKSVQSWSFTTIGVGVGSPCDNDLSLALCQPNNLACALAGLVCEATSCTCQPFGVDQSLSCVPTALYPTSPSPRNNLTNVCVNSLMSVRFNSGITSSSASANSNVILEQCVDANCANATRVTIGVTIDDDVVPNDTLRIQRLPVNSFLAPDSWYRVTLVGGASGITSAASLSMASNYSWKFKTKADANPCQGNSCFWTPTNATVDEVGPGGDTPFNLDEITNDCVIVFGAHPYDFTVSDNTVATINPVSTVSVPATPATTADPIKFGVTNIIATNAINNSLTCSARFNVDTRIPRVLNSWPNCSSACTNASIGASFNFPVNVNQLTTSGGSPTIILRECVASDCASFNGGPLTLPPLPTFDAEDPAGFTKSVDFYVDNLNIGTTYQVQLNASQIHSESNEPLVPNNGNLYTWQFTTKTGSGLCAVDHIVLEPENAIARAIDVEQSFIGQAYGPPDECSPVSGQRLNNRNYSWEGATPPPSGWGTSDPLVAIINPLVDVESNGLIDPRQTVATIGQANCNPSCSTEVIGSIDPNAAGEPAFSCNSGGLNKCATLTLQCGYSTDAQCDSLISGSGVGTSSCCSSRPRVVASGPDLTANNSLAGETDICRNAVLTVVFDQALSSASLAGNVFLVKNMRGNPCPVGGNSLLVKEAGEIRLVKTLPPTNIFARLVFNIKSWWNSLWGSEADAAYMAEDNDNLCIVSAGIQLIPGSLKVLNTIALSPNNVLDYTGGLFDETEYAVVILGDDDLADGGKVGILSAAGVTMAGSTTISLQGRDYSSEIISFDTKDEICLIDHLDHIFIQQDINGGNLPHTNREDYFFCARDDCDGDISGGNTFGGGNQHDIYIFPSDKDGQYIVANFSFVESGPDFFNMFCQWGLLESLCPYRTNHHVITVNDGLPGYSQDVRGNFTVTATNLQVLSNKVSKTLGVNLFVCENPWPAINTFPYVDNTTGFEFYYCRDAGGPGTVDDLPALRTVPILPSLGSGRICYGGSSPTQVCDPTDAIPDCLCTTANCSQDGVCASAGLKDLIFPREGIPNSPTNVQATTTPLVVSGGSVDVSWSGVSGLPPGSGYKVYWGLTSGNYSHSLDVGNVFAATINNLNPTLTYYFAVTAYVRNPYGGAESPLSSPVSIIAKDTVAPGVPINVTTTNNGGGRVTVGWLPDPNTSSDVAGYILLIGNASGSYLEERDVKNVTSYILNLALGNTYRFAVVAYDANNNRSGASPEVSN